MPVTRLGNAADRHVITLFIPRKAKTLDDVLNSSLLGNVFILFEFLIIELWCNIVSD